MLIEVENKNDYEKMQKFLMGSGIEYRFPNAQQAAASIIVKDAVEAIAEKNGCPVNEEEQFVNTLIEFVEGDLYKTTIPDCFNNLMYKYDGFKSMFENLTQKQNSR